MKGESMAYSSAKSSVIVGGILGFLVGAAAGAVGMAAFGKPSETTTAQSEPPGGGPPGGPGGMRGGPGPSRGPSPKQRLASLVVKLDLLTDPRKPLSMELTSDQKQKIREQLKGLAEPEDLTDKEANERLDTLLGGVLGTDKSLLESTGFLWPGVGPEGPPRGPGEPPPPRNPFHDKANGKHLKSLEERLAKDKSS
jgi:hypothetical protein